VPIHDWGIWVNTVRDDDGFNKKKREKQKTKSEADEQPRIGSSQEKKIRCKQREDLQSVRPHDSGKNEIYNPN